MNPRISPLLPVLDSASLPPYRACYFQELKMGLTAQPVLASSLAFAFAVTTAAARLVSSSYSSHRPRTIHSCPSYIDHPWHKQTFLSQPREHSSASCLGRKYGRAS